MSEELLELAIGTMLCSHNTPWARQGQKACYNIRRRAATVLTVENGEVFVERRGRKVKVITTVAAGPEPNLGFICTSTFYHIL